MDKRTSEHRRRNGGICFVSHSAAPRLPLRADSVRLGRVLPGPALLAAALSLLSACAGESPPIVEINFVSAKGDLLELDFTSSRPLETVEVFDGERKLLIRQNLGGTRSGRLLIPHPEDSAPRRLAATSVTGSSSTIPLEYPAARRAALSLRNPFLDETDQPTLAAPGSRVSLVLDLPFQRTGSGSFTIDLRAQSPLLVSFGGRDEPGDRVTLSGSGLAGALPLPWLVEVDVPGTAEPGRYSLEARLDIRGGAGERAYMSRREVLVRPLLELQRGLVIEGIVMPAGPDGREKPGMQRDTIILADGLGQRGDFTDDAFGCAPVAYQSVRVSNSLADLLPVVVSCAVFDGDGRPCPAFMSRADGAGGATVTAGMITAGRRGTLTLPFYADPRRLQPGFYSRKIEISLAGTDVVLHRRTAGLAVERPSPAAQAVTFSAVAATVLFALFVLLRAGRLLSTFSTRQIVFTSLVAGASVILINIPVFFLANVTMTLMGPLGFLVDSLVSEFLYGAILIALLTVVPRSGVCAMVACVRFLLGGLMLGVLTPLGAVHTAVSAVVLEATVVFSGLRRKRPGEPIGIAFVLAYSAAHAAIAWISFQIAMVLFRLHYADWYVILSVAVGGFLYSLLGAFAGRSTGRKLLQVAA